MATGPDRRVLLLAVGIPVAALLAVVGITVFDDGERPEPAAQASSTTSSTPAPEPAVDERWNADLAEVLGPLQGVLPAYVARVEAWSSGELTGAELSRTLDEVEGVLASVDSAARALRPHPDDELADPLVEDAVGLYREAVRSHRAAVGTQEADLAEQYDRLGRRLRILGDRIFDRARERTAVAIDPGQDVRLVLPAEVPDWSRLELAVGPPLDDASDRVGELPLEREEGRAAQAADRWVEAVEELDVPTVADVRSARGGEEELGELARQLVAAAEALRSVPVPDGDRGRADRVALGWLVLADAARAAQLDAITGTDDPLGDRLLELASGPELSAG